MVSILGLSALAAARIQGRSAEAINDLAQARLLAQSAVELGVFAIRSNSLWRTDQAFLAAFQGQSLGGGTLRFDLVDPVDGDLADSPEDPVVVVGTGVKGQARHKTQVNLVSKMRGLSCLETAMHAGSNVTFVKSTTIFCNQKISSNTTVHAATALINANVEAVVAVTGSTYSGTTTTGVALREMPQTTAFDYYLSNGTWIAHNTLDDLGDGYRGIKQRALGPNYNPYGTGQTNAQGIYLVDCGSDKKLGIRQARIVGTLVVVNPKVGTSVLVDVQVNWEPAVANYPALLVRGDATFNFAGGTFTETEINKNLNPPGLPYQGHEDSALDDTYPSSLNGLVYVSGSLNLYALNAAVVQGAVVVGTNVGSQTGALATLNYNPAYLENAPPGFQKSQTMEVVAGSYRRNVD